MRFHPLLPYTLILLAALLSLASIYAAGRAFRIRRPMVILRLCSIAILLMLILSPALLLTRSGRRNANLVFLLDTSSSMSTHDMQENHSRLDEAKGALRRLLRESFQHSKKSVYAFNHTTRHLAKTDEIKAVTPDGNTNLRQALETVDRDLGLSTVSAFILLSDGLDHSRLDAIPGGVPLFAVKSGTDMEQVQDLRLDGFRAPTILRTGEYFDVSIPVTLRLTETPQEVTLKIAVDGKLAKEERFTLAPNERKEIPFRTTFDTPGLHTVTLELNRMQDEASFINNSRELLIEVLEDTLAPVLYFPRLTNSYRPLVRLFSQTGRSFTALYSMRPGIYHLQGNTENRTYAHGIPKNPEEMKETPLLFLGSGNAEDYSDAELTSIEAYTANGGTLMIYGGPDAFGNTGRRLFAALMPVRSGKGGFSDATFRLAPEKEGFFGELGREALTIRGLNRVDYVKAGAEVLLSVEGERKYPLVVSMPYGKGRVIALLTNSLHLLGDPRNRARIFRAFWETLLRHAGTATEGITLSVPEHVPEKTSIKASATAEDVTSLQAMLVQEDVKGGLRQTLPMPAQGNTYACTFPPVPKGKYTLEVRAIRKNGTPIKRYARIHCGSINAENDDLKVSDDPFLKLTTRGRIYSPEETKRLANDINELLDKGADDDALTTVSITPPLALLLFLLLMTEWFLRRKANFF